MIDLMAADIAVYLHSELLGNNIKVYNTTSITNICTNSLSFINQMKYVENLESGALIIVPNEYNINPISKNVYIKVQNPRLSFIKCFQEFFINNKEKKIHATVQIDKNSRIADSVSIGAYCVIGKNVTIGKNTIINNHVVINENTCIGESCYIKSACVIGEEGFGFEIDENSVPLRFPHIGNVEIGDYVEIGAKCTIAKGTFDSTIIKNNVKIDDQVHIAHNCRIEENTLIAACVEVSGSVKIGRNCWIGPNTSIKDKIEISDNVFIGVGSNIQYNVAKNKKLGNIGNLTFRNIIQLKKSMR